MSLNYACEKFSAAVDILVSSPEPFPQRLILAATEACFTTLHAKHLPLHIQEEYENFVKQFTSHGIPDGDGEIASTIRRLDFSEQKQIARKINSFSLYLQGEREKGFHTEMH